MLSISSNRLRYYYENILRQDLLLKLNCANLMQVPKICEILISSQVPNDSLKNISIALEILSGQKPFVLGNKAFGLSSIKKKNLNFAGRKENRKDTKINSGTGKYPLINSKLGRNNLKIKVPISHFDRQGTHNFLETSLRCPDLMYLFLEKFFTILTFFEFNIEYQVNIIHITVKEGTPIKWFPEIENYLEYFENFQNMQVRIITNSCRDISETKLLWTGLAEQKEI